MSVDKKHAAWIDAVSGGVGSTAAKSLLSPIQRIVVLKQLGEHRGMSTVEITRRVINTEGLFRGLWRGNLTSAIIRFPYSGTQFLTYGRLKFFIEDVFGIRGTRSDGETAYGKFLVKCFAGGASATIAGTLTYPGEVIRLRLMSGDPRYRSIIPTARLIYAEKRSMRNFYAGLSASLMQRVPDVLINFATYETVKAEADRVKISPMVGTLLGGTCASIASIVCVYPLDVAKRRMGMGGQLKGQEAYTGVFQCLRAVVRREGFRGLYAGAPLETVRLIPQVTLMWLGVEQCRRALEWTDRKSVV